jgi:uncharacterized protein (TIGR00369 family)
MRMLANRIDSPDAERDQYYDLLRSIHARTPATRFVEHRLEELAPGRARMALEAEAQHLNGFGGVHGGLVSMVLDTTGWLACATLSEGQWLFTAELKVNFLDVATTRVIATAEVLKKGGELMHARMDARTDCGRHLATALAIYSLLPRRLQ